MPPAAGGASPPRSPRPARCRRRVRFRAFCCAKISKPGLLIMGCEESIGDLPHRHVAGRDSTAKPLAVGDSHGSGTWPPAPPGLLLLPQSKPLYRNLECGARRACSRSAIFNFALHQEQASCPEGSEHRASSLRMAPEGPVAPSGPPRPDLDSRGLAKHFRSRAALRALLAGLRPSTSHRSLRSLRRRGFAHYVRLRHYRSSLLAAASNSLTFVRGADRACCAPRKWCCGLTYVPRR